MAKFGSNLGQWNEDEAAFRKARMRNLHSRFLNHRCLVKKNVEIDNPRPAWDKLAAAKAAFDRLQSVEQLAGLEQSFRFDSAIQKPRLLKKIDGLGLIGGRAAQNSHANSRKGFDGALQIRGPISKVRSEGKIDELAFGHHGE